MFGLIILNHVFEKTSEVTVIGKDNIGLVVFGFVVVAVFAYLMLLSVNSGPEGW